MSTNHLPIETRLLGISPEQYTRRVEQAHREARRLRSEAMRDFARSIAAQAQRFLAALRPRLQRTVPARAVEA